MLGFHWVTLGMHSTDVCILQWCNVLFDDSAAYYAHVLLLKWFAYVRGMYRLVPISPGQTNDHAMEL